MAARCGAPKGRESNSPLTTQCSSGYRVINGDRLGYHTIRFITFLEASRGAESRSGALLGFPPSSYSDTDCLFHPASRSWFATLRSPRYGCNIGTPQWCGSTWCTTTLGGRIGHWDWRLRPGLHLVPTHRRLAE
jgi:hypothetical protein